MSFALTAALLVMLAGSSYLLAQRRAMASVDGRRWQLHSLPAYHGLFVALCVLLPAAIFLQLGFALKGTTRQLAIAHFHPEVFVEGESAALTLSRIEQLAEGEVFGAAPTAAERAAADFTVRFEAGQRWALTIATLLLALASGAWAYGRTDRQFRARNRSEQIVLAFLFACAIVAILTTVGIVVSLFAEALRFFAKVPPTEFFFGLTWSPAEAIRADQVGSTGAFGVIPVLAGTFLITGIAMSVAFPIGLLAAIYMVEFADARFRDAAKPVLEILAGIPTVVYGFFAAVTVAPLVRDLGAAIGVEASSQSALAAGSVMGLMIIPFISSLSDDVISAVPRKLREGAFTLGATRGETVIRVVLPAALPGLLSATVLAVSRALGETMIVVMAAGLFARLTANPFAEVTTVTVQITTVLTGDQEFESATTLSAFALALTLFVLTFVLNALALRVMEQYRERYD